MAARRPATSRSPGAWVDSLALLAFLGLLAWWSWGKWPDVFVDFGRELYVPWRLTAGDLLYSDIAYFNGPLSPYVNSALFRLFGTSLQTLLAANLVILAAITLLFYAGLRVLTDRLAAIAGGTFFLSVFAFAQYLDIGNFNYLAPYSHEMTHGMALALAALAGAILYFHSGRPLALLVSGLFLGLVFLTKAELFLAASSSVVVALAFHLWALQARAHDWLRSAVSLAVGVLVAPGIALVLLLRVQPLETAIASLLGTWAHIDTPGLGDLLFYRNGLGLDAPGHHLGQASIWTLGWISFLLFGVLLALAPSRLDRLRGPLLVFAATAPATVIFWSRSWLGWSDVARPLPFVLGVSLAVLIIRAVDKRGNTNDSAAMAIWLLCLLFSWVLLLKMLFNVRLHQYGFTLAAPATVMMIALTLGALPSTDRLRASCSPIYRAWCLSALVGLASMHLWMTADFYRQKVVRVGDGADSFLADSRGLFANRVLDRIATVLPSQATLAVLPEGVTINYLARLENPTPFINFMPPELLIFGEEEIIAAFARHPPDFVLLVNRPAREYGLKLLGRDYGIELMEWIQNRYTLVEQLREPSIEGEPYSFGLLLRHSGARGESGIED